MLALILLCWAECLALAHAASSSYGATARIVKDEGGGAGGAAAGGLQWVTDVEAQCFPICDSELTCNSFSFSPNDQACWFKDKCLTGNEELVDPDALNSHYVTYYKLACDATPSPTPAATTISPTPAPTLSPTATPAPTSEPGTPAPTQESSEPKLSTAVDTWGHLYASGNKLMSENTGEVVRLRGMSLFWSHWEGEFYTRETIKWLIEDWRVTVIRAAMGVSEDGYLDGEEGKAREKAKIVEVVDACIEFGIYVIVDWHIDQVDPLIDLSKEFFTEMAQKYESTPNVLWEPWNEPVSWVSWPLTIKPYHEELVPLIRTWSRNLIILGTRAWSQYVDEAALDPVSGTNLAYTLHFYAQSHTQAWRDRVITALNAGVVIFATEWGTCTYTGDGYIDWDLVDDWWALLDEYMISDANWAISDKNETCQALMPGTGPHGWDPAADLTPSGREVRSRLLQDFTLPTITRTETTVTSDTSTSTSTTDTTTTEPIVGVKITYTSTTLTTVEETSGSNRPARPLLWALCSFVLIHSAHHHRRMM